MNDADSRAMARAAAVLLLASLVRWGWGLAGAGGPDLATAAGQDRAAALLQASRAKADDEHARARPLVAGERLDPNRASASELDRLPGVGASTARAIVASRERDGPYRRPEDLARVRGIGSGTLARVGPHLDFSAAPPAGSAAHRAPSRGTLPVARPTRAAVAAPSGAPSGTSAPVDVNRADEAGLRALPGIGPALAGRILAARAERPFTSVDDLLRVPGIGPATLERLRNRVTVGR